MVQFFLDVAEKCWLLIDQIVEQKNCISPHTWVLHTFNMTLCLNTGKLPNNPMLCYYLQREICQLLGYVALATKEYTPHQPTVCHISFNMLFSHS